MRKLIYTLTLFLAACGGGGGSSPNTPAIVSDVPTVTLSTNVDLLQYPASYQTEGRTVTESDPCKLDFAQVVYPKAWMGQNELPTIKGAPFNNTFIRGMVLSDIMLSDNPNFALHRNCSGSIRTELNKTFQRLKSLNVEQVYIPQWHWIKVNQDSSWYIKKGDDTFSTLSDADLSYAVNLAHSYGFKVYMFNQIQGIENNDGSAFEPSATTANYIKWFKAYGDFLIERAPFFESLKIDSWEITCSYCVYHDAGTGTYEDLSYFGQEYLKLLPIVKSMYKGEIIAQTNAWLINTPAAINYIDVLAISLYYGDYKPTKMNLEEMKTALRDNALNPGYISYLNGLNKKILYRFSLQSRTDAMTAPGHLEESGCTLSVYSNGFNATSDFNNCFQSKTTPDFSIQAIFYEAVFEVLASSNFTNKVIVSPETYWNTDSFVSQQPFPNISTSIRNKPAESIVKAWYKK